MLPMSSNEQHIYHHNEDTGPRIAIKIERNSKSINWEVNVSNCHSVDEAMAIQTEAQEKLRAQYKLEGVVING